MISTAELLAFLTCTAVIMVGRCKAEVLPPPTGLSYRWIDAFTVNVFWQNHSGLPQGYKEKYGYSQEHQQSPLSKPPVSKIEWRNFTVDLLTEEKASGSWTYLVWTVKNGNSPEDSPKVSKTIKTPKPRAQVKEIKCFVDPRNETYDINCSWVQGNQPLTLSFRVCGHPNETNMVSKKCERPYSDAMRTGCHLSADIAEHICMLFESEDGLSTFKLAPMIYPPELSIREEGDSLKLSWTRPKILKNHSRIFTVCYKKCSHDEVCLNYTTKGEPGFLPYDKNCRYELRSMVRTIYVIKIFSDFGQVVFYGTNKPADGTLTVVAIVVPLILSVCILLSCYCFRRHSSILCPVIPDPSVIFKEMMMNGNKELKPTTGNLYTPVPEPIESCKVDSVTDSVVVPLNS